LRNEQEEIFAKEIWRVSIQISLIYLSCLYALASMCTYNAATSINIRKGRMVEHHAMVRHNVDIITYSCMVGLLFRNIIRIIQMVFKQKFYPYVKLYTCTDALFTLSIISQSQNLNRNNADTCKIKHKYHCSVCYKTILL